MEFVEDPPWEKKKDRRELGLDFIGIGLIALGLGCLQVFLDRGEDDDWFKSGFITTFAILSVIGIVGAIFWLLYAKKPVVDVRSIEGQEFRAGLSVHGGFCRHPLWQRGARASACPAAPGLYRDARGTGVVARRE